jgi:hypothetical protein
VRCSDEKEKDQCNGNRLHAKGFFAADPANARKTGVKNIDDEQDILLPPGLDNLRSMLPGANFFTVIVLSYQVWPTETAKLAA